MSVRNRIIATYLAWAIAALGTTLSWATNGSASVNGQTRGLNGGMIMVLALVCVGLIAWWDRGSRFDLGRVRMAMFVGVMSLLILLRNVYNVAIDDIFGNGVSIGYGLWMSLFGAIVGTALTRTLQTR